MMLAAQTQNSTQIKVAIEEGSMKPLLSLTEQPQTDLLRKLNLFQESNLLALRTLPKAQMSEVPLEGEGSFYIDIR